MKESGSKRESLEAERWAKRLEETIYAPSAFVSMCHSQRGGQGLRPHHSLQCKIRMLVSIHCDTPVIPASSSVMRM